MIQRYVLDDQEVVDPPPVRMKLKVSAEGTLVDILANGVLIAYIKDGIINLYNQPTCPLQRDTLNYPLVVRGMKTLNPL